MKICKLIAGMLAAILLLFCGAMAAESIDADGEVRLMVRFQGEGTAFSGAQFRLYRVASMDAAGKFTPAAPFDRYNVQLDGRSESDMAGVASTLEGYVLRDKIAPAFQGTTDSDGMLSFSMGKKQGLYLLLGDRYTADEQVYAVQPALVQLPNWNAADEKWDYAVTINAKFEITADVPSISRKVLKVWKNTENAAALPKEIEVCLLRDGEVQDTVKLNAANSWRYSWDALDSQHHWTVVEKELEDYSVLVTREGITFVITNTYDPKQPVPTPTPKPDPDSSGSGSGSKLPQTGQLWWPVPMLISLGMLLIVIGLLRRRGS